MNSQACPACWHRSRNPADPARSDILPYHPSLNPKPWGCRIPEDNVNVRKRQGVDLNTLLFCLRAPHGARGAVIGGVAQQWLISCCSPRLKKKANACMCVSVWKTECLRVTSAAVSKLRLTVRSMCHRAVSEYHTPNTHKGSVNRSKGRRRERRRILHIEKKTLSNKIFCRKTIIKPRFHSKKDLQEV